MKITYTDSGNLELDRFLKERREQLESIVKRNKYVFGDEEIEITASDIRNAEDVFRRADYGRARSSRMSLVLRLYAFIGVALLVMGIFYEHFKEIILGNPIQLALVMGGVALILSSLVGGYYLRMRAERTRDLLERYESMKSQSRSNE